MTAVRWDPARELSMLQSEMNRLFGSYADGSPGARQSRWVPAMDLREARDSYELQLDLPGMSEDDVTIEVHDQTLRIHGERRDERAEQREGLQRTERTYGRFERLLTIPRGVDVERIHASFDRGVLTLLVPKPEQVQPRRIQIKAGAQPTAHADLEGTASEQASDEREPAHA